jgi:hypothetical protein
MTKSRTPSSYYPQYFKQDLKLKSPAENPISKALDNFIYLMSESLFLSTWQTQKDFYTLENKKAHLKSLGFDFNSLSTEEIHRFFAVAAGLTLQNLADVYFGEATIQKGYPYPKKNLVEQETSLVMIDTIDKEHILFVNYFDKNKESKVNEFILNAKKIVPEYKTIVVALAPKALNLRSGFNLSKDQLQGRRLSCRTLVK